MKMTGSVLVTKKVQQIPVVVIVAGVVIAVNISRETLNLHFLFINHLLIIYDTVPHGRSCQCSGGDRQVNT